MTSLSPQSLFSHLRFFTEHVDDLNHEHKLNALRMVLRLIVLLQWRQVSQVRQRLDRLLAVRSSFVSTHLSLLFTWPAISIGEFARHGLLGCCGMGRAI